MNTLQLDQVLRKHIPEDKFDISIRALMQEDIVWNALNDVDFINKIDSQWPASAENITAGTLALFAIDPIVLSVGYPDASLPAALLEEAMLEYEEYRTQSIPVHSLRVAGLLAVALHEKYRQTNDWNRIVFEITEAAGNRQDGYLSEHWKPVFSILASLMEDPREFFQALFESKARKSVHTLFRHLVLAQAKSADEQANLVISTLFSQPVETQAAVLQSLYQNHDGELLHKAANGLFSRHLVRDLDAASSRDIWMNSQKYLNEGSACRALAVIAQFAGEFESAERLLKTNERILKAELTGNLIQSAALKNELQQPLESELDQIPDELLGEVEIAAEISSLGADTVRVKGINTNIPAFELNEAVKMFHAGNAVLARESAAKSVQSWLIGETSVRLSDAPLRAINWQPGNVIDQLIDMGLWQEASTLARELLAQFPVNEGLLAQAAEIAGRLGDRFSQLAHLEKLNLLDAHNETWRRKLAAASLANEDWQSAFQAYQQLIIEFAASNETDLLGMAKSALKCGEYATAQEFAQKVLAGNSENAQALAISGYAYQKQGNPEKALSLIDRAIEVNADDCEPWLLRADMYAENGETAKSVNTLRSASTAHPESDAIRVRLAKTLIENGQASEALSVINETQADVVTNKDLALLKLQAMKQLALPDLAYTAEQLYQVFPGDAEIRREYAVAQLAKGNREVVKSLLDTATLSGDSALTLAYCDAVLGEDYHRLHMKKFAATKETEKAETLLHNVLLNDPANVYARMLLAETMIQQGKTEKAFEFLSNLLGDPDAQSSNWLSRIQAGFAWVASFLEKFDLALGAAQSVVEMNPDWAGAAQTLAEIDAASGEINDAVSAAETVLEIAPDVIESVEWFANFMNGLDKADDAEKTLAEAVAKHSDKTAFLLKLAEYKLDRNEKEAAGDIVAELKLLPEKIKDDAALLKTAKVFNRLGEKAFSQECLTQRLENPEITAQNALVDLAGFHYSNGKYQQALDVIAQAKSRFGSQRWIDLIEAETLHSNGDAQTALEVLQRLDAANDFLPETESLAFAPAQWVPLLQPQASTDSLLRSLAFESGEYQNALIADNDICDASDVSVAIEAGYALRSNAPMQPWMDAQPEDERIYATPFLTAQVAEILLDSGKVQDAAQVIKRGLELFPQDRLLLANASRYSNVIGDINTAEALLDQILPMFPHSDKYASALSVCALRNLVKTAAALNRWVEALAWQQVLLRANARNLAAVELSLQTLMRAQEFALFTEDLGVTSHFNYAPEQMQSISGQLKTLLGELDAKKNHFFDHWMSRAKAAMEPNQANIRSLALNTPEADDVAAMMLALHRAGQTGTALQLVNKFENDAKVAFATAFCLKGTDPEKALTALKNARKSASVLPWSNVLAHTLYSKIGENYSAINEMEEALQSWPQEPEWHVLTAECWQRTGDSQNAIHHLEQAEKLLPGDTRMNYLLGKAYLQSGETKKSIEVLEASSKNAANHYETWETLAEAYFNAGAKEKSLQAAEKAASINGFSVRPAVLSARINLDNGDAKKALELAQSAVSHDEQDAESLVILAKAWLANGNKMQAMQALEKVAHAKNASVQVLIDQAQLVQEINGSASAKVMLEALEQKYPENTEVLNLLAEAQLACGDKAGAQTSAMHSLKLQELQPRMQHFVGHLDLDAGHLDQAIHHFSQSIAQAPQDADVYIDLSEAYIQQRDFESALKTLDSAIDLAPDDIRPLISQANLLRNGKDYARAETRLRKAAEIAPNDLNIRRQLGAVIALNMVHSSQEASSHI
jgi:tetratricopeptide (TPR) repeat protein